MQQQGLFVVSPLSEEATECMHKARMHQRPLIVTSIQGPVHSERCLFGRLSSIQLDEAHAPRTDLGSSNEIGVPGVDLSGINGQGKLDA
jgi:hypothetical protein